MAGWNGRRGFSLIEVLIAIAIMSVMTVLLFQSLIYVDRQFDRIKSASTDQLENIADERIVRSVLSAVIQDWPGGENRFDGRPDGVKGLTNLSMSTADAYSPFAIEIVHDNGATILSLTIEGATISYETGREPLEFRFYAEGLGWFSSWPADLTSEDPLIEVQMSQIRGRLPSQIALKGEDTLYFTIDLEDSVALPLDASDLLSSGGIGPNL